ncbi:MAG: amidohydrolase family protein [Arcanobacterium sp.]|nr:amidohydrolase family protein [Arcanobacterium sp.]
MIQYSGKVLNGRGELIGGGLELDDSGKLVAVLPVNSNVSGWILPGLIDIHCHGGGGASFPDDTDDEGISRAIAAHRERGTTALLASLVSMADPIPVIEALVPWCERGELLGIHLEGPYISAHKCGAQNPAVIRNPDLTELRSWLEAGKGWIKTMTIAPELPLAQEAANLLHEFGAIPSWGHTSANSAETAARLRETADNAKKVGLTSAPQTATHLFNAMPPLAHREPGPIRELIQAARRNECVVELVADGVHLDRNLVGDVTEYLGISGAGLGVAYVTDAMAGAGMPDGEYVLGSLPVEIADGVARLAQGGAIAGGTARLLDEVIGNVQAGVVNLAQAVQACVAGPALAIGASEDSIGVTLTYRFGSRPNFLVLNSDLELELVVREGEVLH